MPTYPLRQITQSNASPFCITATAGTEICQDFFFRQIIFFQKNLDLQLKSIHH